MARITAVGALAMVLLVDAGITRGDAACVGACPAGQYMSAVCNHPGVDPNPDGLCNTCPDSVPWTHIGHADDAVQGPGPGNAMLSVGGHGDAIPSYQQDNLICPSVYLWAARQQSAVRFVNSCRHCTCGCGSPDRAVVAHRESPDMRLLCCV